MRQRTIALTVATALFAGTFASAQAASTNPLHPSYFSAKAKAVKVVSGTRLAYVDSGNPLHPMFGRTADWQMVAQGTTVHYVDSHNPLHPSFRRF